MAAEVVNAMAWDCRTPIDCGIGKGVPHLDREVLDTPIGDQYKLRGAQTKPLKLSRDTLTDVYDSTDATIGNASGWIRCQPGIRESVGCGPC